MSRFHSMRSPDYRPRPANTPPVFDFIEVPCPMPGLVGPCKLFRGAKIRGYGNVGIGSKSYLVHRLAWEQAHGPIPEKMEIDHQCRNRSCFNVLHLRLVTHKVNTTENSFSVGALNKVKTHCPSGHEYTPENTRIARSGSRVCRACHTRQNAESRARRKARTT